MNSGNLMSLVVYCLEEECNGPVVVCDDVVIFTRPQMAFFGFNFWGNPVYKCPRCGKLREVVLQRVCDELQENRPYYSEKGDFRNDAMSKL